MQFARVNDITMHFQVIGASEDRPLLVFVNSLGTDFRIWRDVAVGLAGEVGIVVYDKRGHGLTDAPDGPYSMQDHVDDLAALLDNLNVSGAIICGISIGGMIALGLAASRPELVRALVLCDTGYRIGNDEGWNARIAKVQGEGIAAISNDVVNLWFTEPFRTQQAAALAGYRNMLERQPAVGYAGSCAALRDCDYAEQASELALPCLCIVGGEDGSTPPAMVRELAARIPGARFETVNGAGHLPCIEKPEELTALIRGFVGNLQGI